MGITVLSSMPALDSSVPADTVAAGPAVGTSLLAAHGDHIHRTPASVLQTLLTASAPADTAAAAAVGTALLAARGDHQHKIADTGWQNLSLINNWVNYDTASFGPAQYRKVGGVVYVRGLVKNGTASSDITTLPAGYRPAYIHIYSAENSGAYTRLDVLASGVIHVFAAPTAYVSLCPIMFVAEA